MYSTPTGTGLRLLFHSLAVTLVAMLILALANKLVIEQGGLPIPDGETAVASLSQRMRLRWLLLGNNLGLYGLPAILSLYLTFGRGWSRMAGLVRPVFQQVPRAVLAFLASLPLVALAAYLNLQVDLPQWMAQDESESGALLATVLDIQSTRELLMTLFAVAVIAGLSEELLFRGVLQGRLLPHIAGPHAAIWIAAFLFSAIHFQFAGFLPRFLLGAALGYTYRWTGSLYVPILLHMLFNGIQVVVAYATGTGPIEGELEAHGTTDYLVAVVSAIVDGFLFIRSERYLAKPPASS